MSDKRIALNMRIDSEFQELLEKGMKISGVKNKSDFIRMCVSMYINEYEKTDCELNP